MRIVPDFTPLREGNDKHEPKGTTDRNNDGKGDGGQFAHKDGDGSAFDHDADIDYGRTDTGSPVELITKGVDWDGNAHRMTFDSMVPLATRAALEEELRALPLVHGTSITGAIAAAKGGLQSFHDLEDERQDMLAEMNDIKADLAERLGVEEPEGWTGMTPEDVQDAYPDLSWQESEEVSALFEEMIDLERIIAGKTFMEDKQAGLDRFVFMTHGKKLEEYGDAGVVLDNALLEQAGTWATPRDIVVYRQDAVEDDPSEEGGDAFGRNTVSAYRDDMVRGTDVIRAAAADAKLPSADAARVLSGRTRNEMWEIKTPRVPPSAIKGFVVTSSIEDAQRLSNKLGRAGQGRVLYLDGMAGGDTQRWLHDQMKYVQVNGSWNPSEVDLLDEQTGNSGTVMLF